MTTSQTQSIFQHGRRLNLGMYSIHLVMPRSWILVPCHHCQSSCLPNVLTHTHKIPHTHKYMHTHSHAHAHRGTHTHTHVHTCKQAHTPTCTHTHTRTHIHTHTHHNPNLLACRQGLQLPRWHSCSHLCRPQLRGRPHTTSQMWTSRCHRETKFRAATHHFTDVKLTLSQRNKA